MEGVFSASQMPDVHGPAAGYSTAGRWIAFRSVCQGGEGGDGQGFHGHALSWRQLHLTQGEDNRGMVLSSLKLQ